MGHASGNVNAVSLGCAELKQGMLTISGRTYPQVNNSIQHFTLYAVHHLDVIHRGQLEVQPPDHIPMRERVEFFGEIGFQTLRRKCLLVKDFYKSSTFVIEDLRL